jgi:hypothetical protein
VLLSRECDSDPNGVGECCISSKAGVRLRTIETLGSGAKREPSRLHRANALIVIGLTLAWTAMALLDLLLVALSV